MRSITLLASATVFAALSVASAMDGFSVSSAYSLPIAEDFSWAGAPCTECGDLVKYDIANTSVVAVDTIYNGRQNGLAQFPVISFDGTKVAFFRSGLKTTTAANGVRRAVPGSATEQCYLSVINRDGTGLRNLVAVDQLVHTQATTPFTDPPCPSWQEGCAVLSWPSGDWIYYDKPTKTGEIWRVNVNDPSLNQFVVKYKVEWLMDGYRAPEGASLWFRRWSMSADAKWAAYQSYCSYAGNGNGASSFPPPGGEPGLCPSTVSLPGCNASISPSGSLIGNYFAGFHQDIHIHRWPRYVWHDNGGSIATLHSGNDLGDVEAWSGQQVQCSDGGQVEWIRWAANSDKWVARRVKFSNFLKPEVNNQILENLFDQQALRTSGNVPQCGGATPPYAMQSCAGHLWVAGGPANSYEETGGGWQEVPPVGIINTVSVTGTNPYEVSITSYPADADIYYTRDGSDPTQSSTRYTGPFSVTAPASPSVALNVKSFKTGLSPSEMTRTQLYAGAPVGTGLNVDMWRGITGDVNALTSDPKFGGPADSTFMVSRLEQPGGAPSSCGYRYRGYLIAGETGDYLFEVASAPQTSIRLSTTEDPADAVEIATMDWEYSNNPWVFNGGTPGTVHLEGNRRYYIEVLRCSRTDGNAGYMVTRLTLPCGDVLQPIPAEWLVPFEPATVDRGHYRATTRPTASVESPVTVQVYTLRGELVGRFVNATIPQHKLPAGTYLIKTSSDNGAVGARMLVRGRSITRP